MSTDLNLDPLLIGERINVITIKMRKAMEAREKGPIQEMAVAQVEAGANCLDLNAGPCPDDPERLAWLTEVVQEVVQVPMCLDTTNVKAMDIGLAVHKNNWGPAIINSTSGESKRLNSFMPLAAKYNCCIIGLTLTGSGLPADANERAAIAVDIMTKAAELGVPNKNIIFDPLAMTVKGNQDQAMAVIESVEMLREMDAPPMKSSVGLSNIVSMCPVEQKGLLTAVYWVMLREAGLTGAIIDPLEKEFMEVVRSNDATVIYKKSDVEKTIEMFKGNIMYADSYLTL